MDNVGPLLGRSFDALNIILPLGISFITFQKIAYLVDVWCDPAKPSKRCFLAGTKHY